MPGPISTIICLSFLFACYITRGIWLSQDPCCLYYLIYHGYTLDLVLQFVCYMSCNWSSYPSSSMPPIRPLCQAVPFRVRHLPWTTPHLRPRSSPGTTSSTSQLTVRFICYFCHSALRNLVMGTDMVLKISWNGMIQFTIQFTEVLFWFTVKSHVCTWIPSMV
jgi:hypothetical protein